MQQAEAELTLPFCVSPTPHQFFFFFAEVACEYKKVPKMAMAEPSALSGLTGLRNTRTVEIITTTRFIVLPIEKVRGLMSSRAW